MRLLPLLSSHLISYLFRYFTSRCLERFSLAFFGWYKVVSSHLRAASHVWQSQRHVMRLVKPPIYDHHRPAANSRTPRTGALRRRSSVPNFDNFSMPEGGAMSTQIGSAEARKISLSSEGGKTTKYISAYFSSRAHG